MEGKRIADLSPDASLLKQRLETVKVGEVISYTDLSAVISSDVRQRRSALMRARLILMREKDFVFVAVKNVGIKRLSADEIARLGEGFARRIRKVALRGIKTLACVGAEFASLTEAAQVSHNSGMTLLSFLRGATTAQRYAKIEERVRESQKVLPTSKLLELFK